MLKLIIAIILVITTSNFYVIECSLFWLKIILKNDKNSKNFHFFSDTGTQDASKHAKPFTVAPDESSIPLAITQYSFFGGRHVVLRIGLLLVFPSLVTVPPNLINISNLINQF